MQTDKRTLNNDISQENIAEPVTTNHKVNVNTVGNTTEGQTDKHARTTLIQLRGRIRK